MTEETFKPRGPKNKKLESHSSISVEGWVKPAVGIEIEGKVLGWIPRKGIKDNYGNTPIIPNIVIQLTEGEVTAFVKGGDEVICKPGDNVAVPVNASFQKLLGYIHATPDVYLFCARKKDVNRPSPMYDWEWSVTPGLQFIKKLPPPLNGGKIQFDMGVAMGDDDEIVDKGDDIPDDAIQF